MDAIILSRFCLSVSRFFNGSSTLNIMVPYKYLILVSGVHPQASDCVVEQEREGGFESHGVNMSGVIPGDLLHDNNFS